MAATTLTDRAVIRLSGEDVRGFLQGLVTSDVDGRAAGLGRAADAAGQMPVRLHRLGGWRRPAARLRSGGRGRPDQAAVDLPPAPADPIERDPTFGRSLVAGRRRAPDPRLPDLGKRWLGAA